MNPGKSTPIERGRESAGARLRRARKELGISQAEMAGRVGLAQNSIAVYESGTRTPPLPVLLALEHELLINHQWILDGTGEPFLGSKSYGPVLVTTEADLDRIDHLEGRDKYYAIPYLRDPAAAGAGLVMEDQVSGYCVIHERVAPHPEQLRCVRISGDSMAPTLTDGSIVAVDVSITDLRLVEGKIVCARTAEGEVVIKRLRLHGRHVLLYSENADQEKHPPLIVDLQELPEPVIGQVVWAWVDLK